MAENFDFAPSPSDSDPGMLGAVQAWKNTKDVLSKLFGVIEADTEEKDTKDKLDVMEAELLAGPWTQPTDEEIRKFKDFKPQLEGRLRRHLASVYLDQRLNELEERVRARPQQGSVAETEEGKVIVPPAKGADFSKEYYDKRAKYIEIGQAIATGEGDESSMRKLLLLLNQDLDYTQEDLDYFQSSITLDLVHGIKERELKALIDINTVDPTKELKQKELNKIRDIVTKDLESAYTDNWNPEKMKALVPSYNEVLNTSRVGYQYDPGQGRIVPVRPGSTERVRQAATRAEARRQIAAAQQPDEKILNPNVGDDFLSVLWDSTAYGFKEIHNFLYRGTPLTVKSTSPNAFKRLRNLYGDEAPAALAVWLTTDIIGPTIGTGKFTSTVRSVPGVARWLGKETIKKANVLGKAWRSLIVSLADGVAWTASEKALSAPIEYWETGKDADFVQDTKSDLVVSTLAFGGLNALGAVLSKGWQRGAQKWAVKKLKRRIANQGDLRNLPAAERKVIDDIGGERALEALRAGQIQEAERLRGQSILESLPEDNPFSIVFKAAGDTSRLELGLGNQLAKDLSVSAGGFGDYIGKSIADKTGSHNVLVKGNKFFNLDTGERVLDSILMDSDKFVGELDANFLERMITLSGISAWAPKVPLALRQMSQSRQSQQVREILENIATPVRRYATRLWQEEKANYFRLFEGVLDKQALGNAMAYSDQFNRPLGKEDLVRLFGLSKEGQRAYHNLRRFFDDKWEQINAMQSKRFSRQGFQVLKDSDLDGHGQKLLVKELKINLNRLEDATPYNQKDILDSLPKSLAERIQNGIDNREFRFKDIINEIKNGRLKAYQTYNPAKDTKEGVRFARPDQIVGAEGQRVMGYNPGFFGGVRYKHIPVRVVAINPQALKEAGQGVSPQKNPVINAWATNHLADAHNFINKHRAAKALQKRGYRFVILREGDNPGDMWSTFDASLPNEIGSIPRHRAEALARTVQRELGWEEADTTAFMEALTRPSLTPYLRDRSGMLRGRRWEWNSLGQRGRTVWTPDGKTKVRNDLVPILNQEEAGLEYIRRWTQTVGTGNFREVLREKFVQHYGKYLKDINAPFGALQRPSPLSGREAREFAHAKVVQHLVRRLYAHPTQLESAARKFLYNAAEESAVQGGYFSQQVASRVINEMAIPRHLSTKLKTVSSTGIFLGNVGIALVQLVPAFYSLAAYKEFPWVARMISKPLKEGPKPLRVFGTLVDTVNWNPADVVGMANDAVLLAADFMRRASPVRASNPVLTKQLDKVFSKGRNKHLVDDLYESGYLAEIRSFEDVGKLGSEKFMDAALSFFVAGEGFSKLFTFAAARRAMEGEFNFALRQARKGKALDQELAQWSRWFSVQKDGALKLSEAGQVEAQRRATNLNLNMTREDAPITSEGIAGVFTQYYSTLTAQIADKYVFGEGITTGSKLRMHLLAIAAFGPSALPYAEDVLGPVLWLDDAIRNNRFPEQREALIGEFIDTTTGYIDAMFEMPQGSTRKALSGYLANSTGEHRLNVSQRLFVAAIHTDFFNRNIGHARQIFDALSTDQLGKAAKQTAEMTPATSVIIGNIESVKDTLDAWAQLQNVVAPQGFLGAWKKAKRGGNEDAVVLQEMDNVRRQIVRELPGAVNWSSFLDTFAFNFAGEEVWQTGTGRVVDDSDPWSTRIQLLTGIGPMHAQDAFIIRDMRKDKQAQAQSLGREIGDDIVEGRADAGWQKFQSALEEASESPSKLLYLPDVIHSLKFRILRSKIPAEIERTIEEAKTPGLPEALKTSPQNPTTEREIKSFYGE